MYISLGGNRVTIPRWYLNLFIVFLVSGLWHGANWTFVIWGALHGFYLVFALATQNIREKINKTLWLDKLPFLSTITTFILVAFAWIFFRANDTKSAFFIAKNIFAGIPDLINKISLRQPILEDLGLQYKGLILSALLIVFLETVHYLQNKININDFLKRRPRYARWSIYYALIFCIIYLGTYENRQFIYFQF